MDDRRIFSTANTTHQHQCQHSQSPFATLNSPVRDGHYYDPVHESRDWYQGMPSSPSQTSLTSQIGPAPGVMPIIPFQSTSHQVFQETIRPSIQPRDSNSNRSVRMSLNSARNDSNNSNATSTNQTNFNGRSGASIHYPQYTGLAHSSALGLDFVPSLYHFHTPRSSLSTAPSPPANISSVRPELRTTAFPRQEQNIDLSSDPNINSLDSSHLRRRNMEFLGVFEENEENFFSNTITALQGQSEELLYGFPGGNERSFDTINGTLVSGKKAPSKEAVTSLESVKIEELTGSDRSCIICYNEFGIKNPEGVIEIPLRLPRCKHIFGDKCIKKWFEDSNSCPYCRDKLPSEFSSKKPSDAEAFRMARERIYALSPRSRSEILAMRHLSMVGLANARASNALDVTEQPIPGGFENSASRGYLRGNTPAGRSATDSSERRRQFRGRMGNLRSIYQMNRLTPVWSTRAINSNHSVSGYTRTNSQVPDTPNSDMPEFISGVSSYTGLSRSMRTQTSQANIPPPAWQSSFGESRSSSPLSNSLSNSVGGSILHSRFTQLESPNEVRIEMGPGVENFSNSLHHHFFLHTAQQDFGSQFQSHSPTQSAPQIFSPPFTSRR